MQILFLDESGAVVPDNKKHSKYFTIGGIIIPEDYWHDIYKKFKELKKQYKIDSEIKWRFFSPHNKDEDNGLSHLSFEEKNAVRSKLYEIISHYKSVKIISIVTDINQAYKLSYINNKDDLYWYSYKQVIERFQYHLQDLSRETGTTFHGLIIIDNRLSYDDNRLRHLHYNLLVTNNENYSNFGNLVEGLFIAPSHLSIGIQLADVVAGAIYRKYEKNDDVFFEKIKTSIRNKNGIIEGYGIVKFPKI